MIPFLWISKLRHLRIVTKIVKYIVLRSLLTLNFLLPLLPATLQIIAEKHSEWFEEDRVVMMEDNFSSKEMKNESNVDDGDEDVDDDGEEEDDDQEEQGEIEADSEVKEDDEHLEVNNEELESDDNGDEEEESDEYD